MNIDLLTVDEHHRLMNDLEKSTQLKIDALERRLLALELRLSDNQKMTIDSAKIKVQIVEFDGIANLSTADFARINLVKPQTVRKTYCVSGHYCGVRPEKLANGRLSWPARKIKGKY
jgi:hypothetical protein